MGLLAIMVCLWLASSKPSYRSHETERLPFRSKPRKLIYRMDAVSDRVAELCKANNVPTTSNCAHFVGVARANRKFQYDDFKILSVGEREQYRHWIALSSDCAASLWFFDIIDIHRTRTNAKLNEYCNTRSLYQFQYASPESADHLLARMSDECDGDLPEWLENRPGAIRLVVVLPPAFAALVASGIWQSFAIPSPYSRGLFTCPRWFRDTIDPAVKVLFDSTVSHIDRQATTFDVTMCSSLAQSVRKLLVPGAGEEEREAMKDWIPRLQKSADDLEHFQHRPRTQKDVGAFIEFVLLSDHLRQTSSLQEVIRKSCKLVLPEAQYRVVEDCLTKGHVKPPKKSDISRARLSIDAAMMLWHRCLNWREENSLQPIHYVRYLSWDSSPQFGRDYELAVVSSIQKTRLPSMLQQCQEMAALWDVEHESKEEAMAYESELMNSIRQGIKTHALPATLIGFGASSFPAKLATLVHACRLDHFTNRSLSTWFKEIAATMSDMGTERLLSQLQPVPAEAVCPYFDDFSKDDISLLLRQSGYRAEPGENLADVHLQGDPDIFDDPDQFQDAHGNEALHVAEPEDDAFEVVTASPEEDAGIGGAQEHDDLVFEDVDQDATDLDITGSLDVPGLHHLIDNATDGLSDAMPNYDESIKRARNVCKLVRKKNTQPKLLQRCFSHDIGPQLQPALKRFKGHIHQGRWGIVAFCISELRKAEFALRWGWDKNAFLAGGEANDGDDADAEQQSWKVKVDVVDQAVLSPFWWAWLLAFDFIAEVLRQATVWAGGCSCHSGRMGDLDPEDPLSTKLRKQWESCPMRGLRAAELSANEFLEQLYSVFETTAAQLSMSLPEDISGEERRSLIEEFDSGRVHLCYYFAMKLSHFSEMPWAVFRISHYNEHTAKTALRMCLASDSQHPRLLQLKGPLRHAAQSWLQGSGLDSPGMEDLVRFIAELRFAPVTDRPAESQHAKTHERGLGRPCHSVPFQSYGLRVSELCR